MIRQITIIKHSNAQVLEPLYQQHKVVIEVAQVVQKSNSFDLSIEFNVPIIAFRNHDYTWADVRLNRIATEFSPKILQLENGCYVQANISEGVWQTDKNYSNKLLWRFNPEGAKTLTVYSGNRNEKHCVPANSALYFPEEPALLFSDASALEVSRSEIPFSAIACFTDHCDFDTAGNLRRQREFFKEKNIKVTKGFFLNHFSKRADNASMENDAAEMLSWKNDGHELCYHSLSQSIKSPENSWYDFKNFSPPFPEIPVWIDHGYQPYNLSLFAKSGVGASEYETILEQKKVKLLWNYIDSGTATNGVINQLNAQHFTLDSFAKGNKKLGRIRLWQAIIKNIVFHYLNDERTISQYKLTAQNFKKIAYQKQFRAIPSFIGDFTSLSKAIVSVLFSWNSNKYQPFKLAKYTPLFFKHTLSNGEFTVFQTLEMIDFSTSLAKENIDLLIKESGIFIAHTYFSDPIGYHSGKLFNGEVIDQEVNANFDYLSEKIKSQSIWNPTLSQLYDYMVQLRSVVFDVDQNGSIFVKNATDITSRKVSR